MKIIHTIVHNILSKFYHRSQKTVCNLNLSSSLKDRGTNSTNYLVVSRLELKKNCTLLKNLA